VDDPRHIARAIRGRPPSTSNLRQQLQVYFSDSIINALQEAAKCGVIVHGSQRVSNSLTENITAILFSANAGEEIRRRIGDKKNKVTTYIIPLSSAEIGTLLGRGPRSVLALRPGRKTQSLIETLRGWDSLG
jgi:ribosomal protein L7Ae-like RNA K-turn-binding protein